MMMMMMMMMMIIIIIIIIIIMIIMYMDSEELHEDTCFFYWLCGRKQYLISMRKIFKIQGLHTIT